MTRIHLRQLNFLIANCSTSSKPQKKFECLPSKAYRSCLLQQWTQERRNEKPAQQKHSEAQTTLDNQYVKMLQI